MSSLARDEARDALSLVFQSERARQLEPSYDQLFAKLGVRANPSDRSHKGVEIGRRDEQTRPSVVEHVADPADIRRDNRRRTAERLDKTLGTPSVIETWTKTCARR